jgi:hypothetical protein
VARFVFKTIVRRGPQFDGVRLAAEVGWLASLGGSFEPLIVSREMYAFKTPTELVFDRQASERHSIRLDRDLEFSIQLDFLRSQSHFSSDITTRAGALTNLPHPWQGGLHASGMRPFRRQT